MVVARTSLSLGTSTYTLTLQGLNPNGGDNTMLVDAVKQNGVLVPNGGFETPVLPFASYMMNPVGATWSFIGTSGISRNGSGFSAKANAPEGLQAGIVEMSGSISQQLSLASGSYTFSFQAVQRPIGNATYQQVRATLQDTATIVTSTKQFVWNGNSIVEERDANNNVTRRFYPQGEQISGVKYFYAR